MRTLANEADRNVVAQRIGRVGPDAQARWGKMNAHQMICHLNDAYKCPLGEKSASAATGLFQRTVMKFGALYLPFTWPKGVPTRPEMEQGVGGTAPVEFERDRRELLDVLQRFSALGKRSEEQRHPIFGKMSEQDWMRWGFLHADHHLRQFGF
ncbi:MAG: DinB family protein [Acidobacteriaceae bacterium]|nr:DinB family protein [Acidobacteriaceae bacterium]